MITNTDMLEDPNGHLKAFVWSEARATATSARGRPVLASSDNEIIVEDWFGHRWSTTLGWGHMQFDVALANSPTIGGGADYQLLVTYMTFDPVAVGTPIHHAWLEIYDLHDVGMPSIHAISRGAVRLSDLLTGCYGVPHIDMWSDANLLVNGWPSMHKFAVVWSDRNGVGEYWVDNVSTFPFTGRNVLPVANPMHTPDVACRTDVATGEEYTEVVYGANHRANSFTGPTNIGLATGLEHLEYNITAGATATSALDARPVYGPRIEAMSQYQPGPAKYQVAASVATGIAGGATQVLGYNSLITGPTDFSSLLAPVFPPTPPTFLQYSAMGACVAAGPGRIVDPANIGNTQYTAGFFPWQYQSVYARGINPASGALIIPAQCHEINSSSEPISYHWDVNQSLAVTNCSNSGRDLLSMWYDGSFFRYTLSVPNVMNFRQSKPARHIEPAVYPSPASSTLQLRGLDETAPYRITDMQGRQVAGGTLQLSEPLNISTLAAGIYTLDARAADGEAVKLRFTKL